MFLQNLFVLIKLTYFSSCDTDICIFGVCVYQVRNSSTLLFSTLITRIFGVKKGKDEHSKKNRSASSPSRTVQVYCHVRRCTKNEGNISISGQQSGVCNKNSLKVIITSALKLSASSKCLLYFKHLIREVQSLV